MKILITERQIRLILQEAITEKDYEEFIKNPNYNFFNVDDRKDDIKERLENVFKALKTNPEFIKSENIKIGDNIDERLYFEFKPELSEKNKKEMNKLISDLNVTLTEINEKEKTKPKNKKTYSVDEKSFLEKMVKYSFITEKGFKKNGEMRIYSLLDEYGYNGLNNEIKGFLEQKHLNLKVVISKSKFDIIGMSSGRGWVSCMTIPNKKNQKIGELCHKIFDDIQQGTLIAYIIKSDDENIENPLARMLIKPHIGESTVYYKPERVIYGHYDLNSLYSFLENLLIKVNENSNDFLYIKHERLYDDDDENFFSKKNEKINELSNIRNKNERIDYIKNVLLKDNEVIENFSPKLLFLIFNSISIVNESKAKFFIENILPNIKLITPLKGFFRKILPKFDIQNDIFYLINNLFNNIDFLKVFGIEVFDAFYYINKDEKIKFIENLFFNNNNIFKFSQLMNITINEFIYQIFYKIDEKDRFDFFIKNVINKNNILENFKNDPNYIFVRLFYHFNDEEVNKLYNEYISSDSPNKNSLLIEIINKNIVLQSFLKQKIKK